MKMLVSMTNGFVLASMVVGVVIGLELASIRPWSAAIVAAVGSVAGLLAGRGHPGPWIERLATGLWLGVVPAWGFWTNRGLDPCTEPCGGIYQAVDASGVHVVAASYAVALAAFVLHRWRPNPRHPGVEALLVTALGQGLATCIALGVQFGPAVPMGLVFAPVGLPLVAPAVAGFLLAVAAYRRLAALGRRDQAVASGSLAATLGAWTLATWSVGPWLGAFTQTCGWTLSQLRPPEADCHYLCTVAAQGSPALVRPLRMGQRRGRPIVVNRQLAVANAFEDLLHERWPRLGRSARRLYDALARDVSRMLCHRWMANLVFVAMVPAQLCFELLLLALDPEDPETRIDRMYR